MSATNTATALTPMPAGAAQQPSICRIVNFVLPAESKRAGEIRPAIVVRAHTPIGHDEAPGMVNLHVFLDGLNDLGERSWKESVIYSAAKAPGTWHWPARV